MRYLLLTLCLFGLAFLPVGHTQCDFQTSTIPSAVSCFGGSNGAINLTVTNGAGPITYLWSNNSTTEDITGLTAGSYTVTVTDGLGCTATTNASISQPTSISVTFQGSNILNCTTPSIPVSPTVNGGVGPYWYNWSDGQTTAVINLQAAGTYTVTVTDANNCTKIGSVTVTQNTSTPVACIAPPQVLTCVVTTITLSASCTSQGPNYVYTWTGPGIVSGQNTLNPTIAAPGTYTIVVTDVTNGCTSVAAATVVEDFVPPTADAGPVVELPCGGGITTLMANSSIGANFIYSWATVNGNIVSGGNTINPIVDEPGVYQLLVVNTQNGCTATDETVVVSGSSALCGRIAGNVLEDVNLNCLSDAGDSGLNQWIVQATGATGTYFALTNATGAYEIYVEPGDTYQVTSVPLSLLWAACPSIPDVTVNFPNQTYPAQDLLFQKVAGCPLLTVDISSGNLRRCFSNNLFSVHYCNNGTEPATDAYVDVTLESLFTIVNTSIPFLNQGNNVYRFLIGDLDPGDCGSFNIKTHLSCDAAFGQTHCAEAHIYPDTTCLPTNPLWSGASLRIQSTCSPDSVRFQIKNVGIGNMNAAVDYIVIEDQVMLMSAPILLDIGESTQVSVPANGSTWRLEVEQVPFHPGFSYPSISVEGCTTNPVFSTGFVNMFPQDDLDPYLDIHCQANTGSYDPNDKTGYPLGYGANHYIRPGTPLEYLIRFQNTGNDTAFTVRIEDTLSQWLDPATLRPGASSHAYTWNLSGAGLLTFLFENILLPDSNVNEPASHGYVKFTINHKADAP
ncbi:MAG: hypothetical protein JNN28_14260, partial [Saprospiraceae bacterium]|nr:hypothetical protein [Saprospiraceae bacterium]